MSIAELVVVLGLVAGAFVIGHRMGRSSRRPAPSALSAMPRPAHSDVARASAPPRGATAGAAPVRPSLPPPDLATVRRWGCQLQALDVTRAAASAFDLLIVDYARDGTDGTALTPADVARLQRKPDGARRVVLAYLSIGEAESYRFYWRKVWAQQRPAWLLGENPDCEQNYAVRFWEPAWQALLHGSPGAYLDRIIAQGFDGVCLDRCDVADDLRRREKQAAATRPDLEGDMAALIGALADYARARHPGFLVVVQNAEPLLERADVRRVIDAAAKEELLFGLDAAERANDAEDIAWSRRRLDRVREDGKPVLVLEYLNDAVKIAEASRMARGFGYLLHVSDKSRELDALRETPPPA
jgi:cysteinyl-tRNA synthetase